jgi:large subunit ribosomal protein L6
MERKNMIDLCGVSLFRYHNFIVFLGLKGRAVLDVEVKSSYSKFQMTSKSLKVVKPTFSESKLESMLNGLETFYHKKLNLVGIGFRAWCYFDSIKNCQVLIVKLGLSKDVLVFIPSDIIVLCLRPTLILIKGVDKEEVGRMAREIRSIRVPDSYKGKGVRYENEVIHIKPGKQK